MNLRLLPVQAGILTTFALFPAWLKLPDAPPPFTATYVLGMTMVIPMLWTIAAWLLLGCPGLRTFLQDKWRCAWGITLVLLVTWAFYAQSWAFVREAHPGVAQNFTLQLVILAAFLLVTACAAPPVRVMILLLLAILVWHMVVGGAQVANQKSLGLTFCGEIELNPQQSGISVIQSGDVRWLRPYGCLPHPNIGAGVYIVGIMAAAAWAVSENRRIRAAGMFLFLTGLWMLLLSFSRGAWIGFAVGVLAALPFLMHLWRRLIPLTALALAAGMIFFLMYQPLILSRTGAGQENTEMRSIADRIVYNDIAMEVIEKYPLLGVGGGNFPWYASHYLYFRTDYDLRGDNVHNIYLMVWTEIGLIGLCLFILFGIFGISGVIREIRRDWDISHVAILGGFIALAVVGLVDHYPWTLIQGLVMWQGLLAAALKDSTQRHGETETQRKG